MKRSILQLEAFAGEGSANKYRTIFKNQHGRHLFLSLEVDSNYCTITDCFYTDRNQGRTGSLRYSSKPSLLQSFQFPSDNLLSVIETELDKMFFGVEYIHSDNADLTLDEYLQTKTESKYRFLIMVGEGSGHNGLPAHLRTRLKNKLHRAIYVELEYYKDGKGVVKQCHYYDRQYRRNGLKITPRQMLSCFFPYSREGIINLLNHELCCDFTHIIITSGIDIESNTTPLCGAI